MVKLFLACSSMQNIRGKLDAQQLQQPWALSPRSQILADAASLQQHNAAAKEQGTPQRFFWRSLYLPEQGMFCQAPADMQLGILCQVGG